MTTITLPAQVIRATDVEDDDSASIVSVRSSVLKIFVKNANATFSYRTEKVDADDDWPDVLLHTPPELRLMDARGKNLDVDDSEVFLGTATYQGRASTFLLLEQELSDDLYDSYLIHLGGAALPKLKNAAAVIDFVSSAAMAPITSGAFAPGREIAFSSLPGKQME